MSFMSMNSLLAALVVEQEPMTWAEVPDAFVHWVQSVGAFAVIGLVIGLAVYRRQLRDSPTVLMRITMALAGLAIFCFALYARVMRRGQDWFSDQFVANLYLFACGLAIIAVLLPMLPNLIKLRPRRIWALTKLSFKEAVRGRVVWVFSAILLVWLFSGWFVAYKPEDQVRNYVRVVYWAMAPMLLISAGLLAAFSIPADLKNQTMHTIVTKPVERFEIVLGRCLGYLLLMTVVLVVMGGLSLIYVARGIDPAAAAETYKARVPVFGDLKVIEGTNVGREWQYREYIAGGASNERAIWSFPDLPAGLADRDWVRCEFAFDIFRTTKGKQGKGVYVTLAFETPRWDVSRLNAYTDDRAWLFDPRTLSAGYDRDQQAKKENWSSVQTDRRRRLLKMAQSVLKRAHALKWSDETLRMMLNDPLAEEYGFYEVRSKEVADYHTFSVDVPAGLFRGATEKAPDQAALAVVVRCESPSQYLGVAKYDLYLLDNERSFEENFFKGILGLWYRVCLVVVLAVTLSTYLSGIIAFMVTGFIYALGLLKTSFLIKLASGQYYGGGPLQSALHLAQNTNPNVTIDRTPLTNMLLGADEGFRFGLRFVMSLFPNVERFDLTDYVAEGFNISSSVLLADNLIPLIGYLLPWLVLAYYLMKSREIAN